MMFGSYGFNTWFYTQITAARGWNPSKTPLLFNSEADIQRPSLTPVFADANWEDGAPQTERALSRPLHRKSALHRCWADDMGRFAISRHGGVIPTKAPRKLLPGQALSGAINVVSADGHAQLVPLENLWTLYWHHNWLVPDQRPLPQ